MFSRHNSAKIMGFKSYGLSDKITDPNRPKGGWGGGGGVRWVTCPQLYPSMTNWCALAISFKLLLWLNCSDMSCMKHEQISIAWSQYEQLKRLHAEGAMHRREKSLGQMCIQRPGGICPSHSGHQDLTTEDRTWAPHGELPEHDPDFSHCQGSQWMGTDLRADKISLTRPS